jgi:predicted Zn-dependent protease
MARFRWAIPLLLLGLLAPGRGAARQQAGQSSDPPSVQSVRPQPALPQSALPSVQVAQKNPSIPAKQKRSRGLNFWSPEKEMQLGKELSGQVESTVRLLEDPIVVDYVAAVSNRIARNSETLMPVQVRVIDSSSLDSFSLPGGYLYITTGMLMSTQTEAELAALLSHEIAHVACRHATRQMTRGQLMNFASLPLLFIGGPVAFAVRQGMSLVFPLSYLKFSRNAEHEADQVGLAYMNAAGYDPAAAVALFERAESQQRVKHAGIVRLFSTHPMAGDRLAAISRTINQLPVHDEYVVSTSRHEEILVRLLRSGAAADSGVPVLRRKTDFRAGP